MSTPEINLDWVMAVTDEFTGQHNIIPIPRTFVEWLGDYHCAALLNQIIYWSSPRRNKREGGWFYKSAAEWLEELGLTEYQIRRATRVLTEKAGVETKRGQVAGGGTPNFYRLNRAKFSDSYLKFLQDRKLSNSSIEAAKTADTYTETTPEPTAEREIAPALVTVDIPLFDPDPTGPNRDMQIASEPPGRYIKLRKDAPPVRPVPKPSDDPAVVTLLDELRAIYPFRDGKVARPALALRALAGLSPADRDRLKIAAGHYAVSRDGQDGYAKDLHTWIADGEWLEYLTPAKPRPVKIAAAAGPAPRPYTIVRGA
jgi:hypothetical protein